MPEGQVQSQSRKPPTQRAIADLAGVAQETVSHILNGNTRKHYSPATVENVKRIAQELGYSPHRASRSMRQGRSNLIAVIHFGSRFRTGQEALSYLPQAIRAKGYDYVVNDLQWHGNDPERVVADLIASRVEGVVLLANVHRLMPDTCLERLVNAGISIVSVYGSRRENLPEIPLVCGDVASNVSTMIGHFLGLGHSRVLSLATNNVRSRLLHDRVEGFEKAFAGKGSVKSLTMEEFLTSPSVWDGSGLQGVLVEVDSMQTEADNMRLHYEVMKKAVERNLLPDAWMATNDQGAFGLFTAAFELGLKIPKDLAVSGVDNDPFGEYPAYQLTTFQPATTQICETSVEMLLDRIAGKSVGKNGVTPFPSRLIVRGSCGAKLSGKEC